MPGSRINGFSIAYTAVGGILLWSGLKGSTISDTFQSLLKGQPPKTGDQPIGTPQLSVNNGGSTPGTSPNSSGPVSPGSVASTGSAKTNQAIGKLVAAPYGWATGQQWQALLYLWTRESSWDNQATNQSSGAYGIAQALGHGNGAATQGSVTNEYGGYGISDAEAQAANSGSAAAQITWGLQYIKQTYGTPVNAWAHEESAGWY